ncbi:restriction endonuclease subunit S [Paraburkholderia sp. BR13439]|uniref:restriction endonuclease subunit S n=1 Tax=Paraburkholderia sp. BR13439 TaxID=3236996 RepID=UPI0034CD3853
MSSDFELPPGWSWETIDTLKAEGRSVVSGPFGSNIGKRFFVEHGVPVIRGNNLTLDMERFLDVGFVFLTDEKAAEFTNCEAHPGDLIFTAAGTIGQVGIIPRTPRYSKYIISNKQLRARLDSAKILPLYAYYWLASPPMVAMIQSRNTGSTIPLINLSVLKSLPVPVPPLAVQNEIVGVLSSLDDRITLLHEINATLEAIAEALFKSWFVDFDPIRMKAEGREPDGLDADTAALFPDGFEESALGPVPTGWSVGKLGDLAETVRSQRQPSELNDDTYYIGLEHIPRKSLSLENWGTAGGLESAKFSFTRGNILFGKLRPYFHKVVIAPFDGVCSTDILVCKPKAQSYYGMVTMHLFSEALIDYADRLSNGAKMPRVNWKDLAAYPIVVPPIAIAEQYWITIRPLLDGIVDNVHKATTLAALRDALLPRLISGQLDIVEAEAMLEGVA